MTRKVFTKAIKAEVAIEAIKGQKTIGELSESMPSQIGTWKRELMDNAAELFSRCKGSSERKLAVETW